MKVLYFNNCWFTNVGEAFIDIGATELICRILNHPQIISVSDMNRIYTRLVSKREKIPNPYPQNKSLFNMFDHYSADYFVLAGMFASEQFVDAWCGQEIIKLSQRGVKIIFLGLGQALYTSNETERFKKYLEKLKSVLIMTRDDYVYDSFSGVCPIVRGIDCAFWGKDSYDPRTATVYPYDVVTYNRSSEPEELKIRNDIIRAYHMQWQFTSNDFSDNLFISDNPYDYMTLYANANAIYTDLLHATIIGLQYDTPVRFDRVDNRGYAIDALENLTYEPGKFISIKESLLEIQKKKIEQEIIENMRLNGWRTE